MTVQKVYEIRLLNLLTIAVNEAVFKRALDCLKAFMSDLNARHLRDTSCDMSCDIWYTGSTVLAQVYHRFGETGEHHVLIIYDKNLAEHILGALLSEIK